MPKLAQSKIDALTAVDEGRIMHLLNGTPREVGYHVATRGPWVTTKKGNKATYQFLAENGYIEDVPQSLPHLMPGPMNGILGVRLTKAGKLLLKENT